MAPIRMYLIDHYPLNPSILLLTPPYLRLPVQVTSLCLDYVSWVSALGHAASLLFTGPQWDQQHPQLRQKVQVRSTMRLVNVATLFLSWCRHC